jgi:hypothetical protein
VRDRGECDAAVIFVLVAHRQHRAAPNPRQRRSAPRVDRLHRHQARARSLIPPGSAPAPFSILLADRPPASIFP